MKVHTLATLLNVSISASAVPYNTDSTSAPDLKIFDSTAMSKGCKVNVAILKNWLSDDRLNYHTYEIQFSDTQYPDQDICDEYAHLWDTQSIECPCMDVDKKCVFKPETKGTYIQVKDFPPPYGDWCTECSAKRMLQRMMGETGCGTSSRGGGGHQEMMDAEGEREAHELVPGIVLVD